MAPLQVLSREAETLAPDAVARWPRVSEAFDRAASLAPAERREYLAELAKAEPKVACDLAALLSADVAAEGPKGPYTGALVGSAGAAARDLVEAEEAAWPAPGLAGEKLGPYRVVRRLGEGGMGEVWEAERADGASGDPVAVKILKRTVDTEELRALFGRERKTLARLAHPGIARLLGGGELPDGRPYLVLERVNGPAITEWAAEREPCAAELIALFLKVCDAVEAVHRAGVVHRDLKPANILVGEGDEPKLIDFGVAKLTESEDDRVATSAAARLTPAYAAPEQIVGGEITEATDVYALGVVLYELLTGRRPFRRRGSRADALAAEIESETLIRPSEAMRGAEKARTGNTPGGLFRATSLGRPLRARLDAIVLKALRREPTRRYRTVAALARDLRSVVSGLGSLRTRWSLHPCRTSRRSG